MSITFPTFIDKEIVTPEKLNNFVQALESKFTAGLGSAEIAWPLIAGGDLYMNDYSIIGGAKILGMVNAGAPKYAADFALALTDGANGCIFIPPNTTVAIDGESFAGNSLTIIGSGPTSIIKLSDSASAGYMLRNSVATASISLHNLTLDGNSQTGDGLVLRGCHDVILDHVWFKRFTGAALKITDLTGSACSQVIVDACNFWHGSSYHIHMDDCTDVTVSGCQFDSAAEDAIYAVAADADADLKRINITDNVFDACDKAAITVKGAGAFNTKWAYISVTGNVIDNAGQAVSQNGINLGASSAALQHVKCTDNICPAATANGIEIYAQYGVVSSNHLQGAGADGIDLLSSEDLVVASNNCKDAGAYGLVFDDSVDCLIRGNDCKDGTTADFLQGSSTSEYYDNGTDIAAAPPINGWYKQDDGLTIPANALKVGDVVTIMAAESETVGPGSQTAVIRFDGQDVCETDIGATDGVVSMMARLIITGTTTARAVGLGNSVGAASDHGATIDGLTGLDLTSAISVTISGSDGGDGTIFVTLDHAEIQ